MNPNKGTPVYAWTWRVIFAYLGLILAAFISVGARMLGL